MVGTRIKTGLKVASLVKHEVEYGSPENLAFKKNDSAIQTGATTNKNAKALNKKLTAIALNRETPGT